MRFTEEEASSYLLRSCLNATFLSAYLGFFALLYASRAYGDWSVEGSIRRFITSTDTRQKLSTKSILLGESHDLVGVISLIISVWGIVWLFGVAERKELAVIILVLVSMYVGFNSSILGVNLAYLTNGGYMISKLPSYSPRGRKSIESIRSPDASNGQIVCALVFCYAMACLFSMWALYGQSIITGTAATIMNLPSDPKDIYGSSGFLQRTFAHCMELLIFVIMADFLGRLLCSIELLTFTFRQRYMSIASTLNAADLNDAIGLSSFRLESLQPLLQYSLMSPFSLLLIVFISDISKFCGVKGGIMNFATFDASQQMTCIWCIAFPLCVVFTRSMWYAVNANELWLKKSNDTTKLITILTFFNHRIEVNRSIWTGMVATCALSIVTRFFSVRTFPN